MMAKAVFLSMVFLMIMLSSEAQINTHTGQPDNRTLLAANDTTLRMITLLDEEFLDTLFTRQPGNGFGKLTGYFRNDTVFKIREMYGIKKMNDIATTDYFFEKGKLVYVHETERYGNDVSIDSTGTIRYSSDEKDFEGHYYFTGGKFSSKTEGEPQLLPNEKFFESQSKEGQLTESAKTCINLLNRRR